MAVWMAKILSMYTVCATYLDAHKVYIFVGFDIVSKYT